MLPVADHNVSKTRPIVGRLTHRKLCLCLQEAEQAGSRDASAGSHRGLTKVASGTLSRPVFGAAVVCRPESGQPSPVKPPQVTVGQRVCPRCSQGCVCRSEPFRITLPADGVACAQQQRFLQRRSCLSSVMQEEADAAPASGQAAAAGSQAEAKGVQPEASQEAVGADCATSAEVPQVLRPALYLALWGSISKHNNQCACLTASA